MAKNILGKKQLKTQFYLVSFFRHFHKEHNFYKSLTNNHHRYNNLFSFVSLWKFLELRCFAQESDVPQLGIRHPEMIENVFQTKQKKCQIQTFYVRSRRQKILNFSRANGVSGSLHVYYSAAPGSLPSTGIIAHFNFSTRDWIVKNHSGWILAKKATVGQNFKMVHYFRSFIEWASNLIGW